MRGEVSAANSLVGATPEDYVGSNSGVRGSVTVLADQVKSLDWRARRAKKAGAVELPVLEDVLAKLEALLW